MEKSFNEKYGDNVVEIVHVEHDWIDGHESYGRTAVSKGQGTRTLEFHSNYNRREITKVLHDFVLAGFPAGSVGVSEEAFGFYEDDGVHFPVPDCVGIYLDRSVISHELLQVYHRLQ